MFSIIGIIGLDTVVFFSVVKILDVIRNYILVTFIKRNIYIPILRCFQHCDTIYRLLEGLITQASSSKIVYNQTDLMMVKKIYKELEKKLEEIKNPVNSDEFFDDFDYYYFNFKDNLFGSLKDIQNISEQLLMESPEIFISLQILNVILSEIRIFNNNLVRYGDYLDRSYDPIDDTAFYK